eukprot:jgi/Psemu1/236100/estExt_Genewise1.C_390118
MTKAEQRTERSELSDAAKELARVNIDYAKSVDEVRILKAEQDRLKETIADREKKITHFEEELRKSQENVKHYEADVLYADDQIHKLESENGSLQIELDAYREAKVRDSNTDSGSSFDGDTVQIDPQAALLAAAVEKKAVNVSTTNTNSWHLRRLFTQQPASENEDEIHGHVEKLKAENSVKDSEIKKLKSEMVKAQTVFKEKEYSKVLEYERLQKEKEELEHNNAQLLQELELARKLNRTISGALH